MRRTLRLLGFLAVNLSFLLVAILCAPIPLLLGRLRHRKIVINLTRIWSRWNAFVLGITVNLVNGDLINLLGSHVNLVKVAWILKRLNIIKKIDYDLMNCFLNTSDMPDPELLIRTSGECRISNFLLWQIAYSELYFTPKLWPDFRKEDLFEAIFDFQNRERRFGKTSQQSIS